MALGHIFVVLNIFFALDTTYSQEDIFTNVFEENNLLNITEEDLDLIGDKTRIALMDETVEIKCYYETFCPYSRDFLTSKQFMEVVVKLEKYIRLYTNPYGNAKTSENNGTIEFECQHGPKECYGNKLHACALDTLTGTEAVLYNACMMENSQSEEGSDDTAAGKCGESMSINAKPIKECAKGAKGTRLLKHYGEESEKVGYNYVPYILVDGKENDGNNFFRDVCASIKNPPDDCNQV